MADVAPLIETMENRWMRAWVQKDLKTLKSLTAKDFIFLTASKPPAILDRPSWLEAAGKRYVCSSYQFGDLYVRQLGTVALFAAPIEIKAKMDGRDWSETIWINDLWRRSMTRRGWKLAQRVVSRVDGDPQLVAAIKSLQLWR